MPILGTETRTGILSRRERCHMSYPYQNIIALESTTGYATIILDFLGKKKSATLQHQLELMFQKNEYCLIKKAEDAVLQKEDCDLVKNILNQRIVDEHSLLNTNYHFNLVFFLEASHLSEESVKSVLSFQERMSKLLAAPSLQLYSYLCVCKDGQNSSEDMLRFDLCAKMLLEDPDVSLPRLFLIDALPLSEPESWLRATVRALNVLSRDNALATSLRGKDHTIWNWTMTEFDVQAKEEEERIRKELTDILSGTGEFPQGKLEHNFRILTEEALERNQSRLRFSADNIPIPSNVIGGFFKKKSLQDNIPSFAKSIEASFYENVTKRIQEDVEASDIESMCSRILTGIPLAEWENVSEKLRRLELQSGNAIASSSESVPRRKINLTVQPSTDDMRTQINGELSRSVQEIKAWIPECLRKGLLDSLPGYIERHLKKEQDKIKEKLRNIGISTILAVDAQDYLKRLNELNHQMMAVSYTNIYDRNLYILISDDTNNLWQAQYQDVLNIPECTVYNYHSLEEFEFQTLTLTTWRYQEYLKNREYFFKQN